MSIKMTEMQLTFHEDPGHGWLEVPRSLLDEWGIAEKITPYSYEKGDRVYLEEDQDMTTFCEEAERRGILLKMDTEYRDHTPIRNYPRYRKQ